ncbi:MAG: serine O-acetyltransferase [Chloroflexaceae bacterium]|jgi:serine O-acetyltransferase|nr:serine O-acetyltransferase [Chloroflexaceae bacterium]
MSTMLRLLRADVAAIFRNDPAATSMAEVLLYPGLHAIIMHRFAHALWRRNVPFFPRLISQWSRFVTGIEIHPGARIGAGFFIDHGMGTVIGETSEIGDNVMLYQHVTLGGTGKQSGKRHPTLEDDVIVGVGASVLGAITIGKGARIGGGAVVIKDVPAHSTATGIPARVVATRDPVTGITQRVEQLPDPEGDMLRQLRDMIVELESRIESLEAHTADVHQHAPHRHAFRTAIWQQLDESAASDPEMQRRRDQSYGDSTL